MHHTSSRHGDLLFVLDTAESATLYGLGPTPLPHCLLSRQQSVLAAFQARRGAKRFVQSECDDSPPPQVHAGPVGSRATWPNSPVMPWAPRMSCPFRKMPVPIPSEIVITTMSRIFSACPNQTSARTHALAAFSSSTESPVIFSTELFKSNSFHFKLGAKITRLVDSSYRPGRLIPIPSNTNLG